MSLQADTESVQTAAPDGVLAPLPEYQRMLAQYLGVQSGDIFLYWKARVGLYALLKAAGVGKGDEVIMPAYTCVVVPNAVLYCGGQPVYVDIDAATYSANTEQLKRAITSRTKVIICQNTYGLSSELETVQHLAEPQGIVTIEDCTHGFGGYYNGKPNGLTCDAGIYSTQWNKPFSTGIGGFLVTRNTALKDSLNKQSASLQEASAKECRMLKLQLIGRQKLLTEKTYWALLRLYRWLSRKNLVVGSSVNEEITGTTMPENYFKKMATVQAAEGIKVLPKLEKDLESRKSTAAVYTEFLQKHHKNHVAEEHFKNHSFLKYPLLVTDRQEFFARAEQAKISLGDWFVSPLHPVTSGLERWHMDPSKNPVANYSAANVVNMPTTPGNIERVTRFLAQNIELIADVE